MDIRSKSATKVINLAGRRLDALQGAMSTLEGYWSALRRGGRPPARAEIDPRGIDNILQYAFVLERVAPGVARFRTAGSHLNLLMGSEVRGMPLTVLAVPAARKALSEAIERVCSRLDSAVIWIEGEAGGRNPPLSGRLFMLPLADDEGRITRILGCLETEGRIGRQPRRFTITRSEYRPTIATPAETTAPVPAFAEPAAPYTAPPRQEGRPHLRLVADND